MSWGNVFHRNVFHSLALGKQSLPPPVIC